MHWHRGDARDDALEERPLVLVLSADALAAALLGALVELDRYRVAFAGDGETPRDALRRLRPRAALVDAALVDGTLGDASAAAFIGPAKMMGAGVVLFSGDPCSGSLHSRARAHGVAVLQLPPEPGELRAALDRAIRRAGER